MIDSLSAPLQRCSVGSGRGSSITGDHGWANIKPKNTRASGHPEQPSRHSHNHTSVRAAREELHPWVCDPSNGKWCIIEERAGELMKRVARWHFQSDVWSRMTFTEKKPKRQSVRKKGPLYIIRESRRITWECETHFNMTQTRWQSCHFCLQVSSGGVIWLDSSASSQNVIHWIWGGKMKFIGLYLKVTEEQNHWWSLLKTDSADEFRYF